MAETAIVLANGHLGRINAKTTHALVRSSERFRVLGVIDPDHAGQDAGELLDGTHRDIPVFPSVGAALEQLDSVPDNCIVGVATPGGVLPPSLRISLLEAIRSGLTVINGLHQLLSEDPELAQAARRRGTLIIDVRQPRPTRELRFWTGEVLGIPALRVPVLGTDCAAGKRTTCLLVRDACRRAGVRASMVYTGQSGWLQGLEHGFILDSTPNDFVCGELERAILDCYREDDPEVILIEGQSALRNPSGPCGSELIISTGAAGVILQHLPGRAVFIDNARGQRIPPLEEEIQLIRLLGADVWAVTLNEEGLAPGQATVIRDELRERLGLPVVLPLSGGADEIAEWIASYARAARSGEGNP
jgi:uncharacterized NAD-dependent epimerase/dehydratase family protein